MSRSWGQAVERMDEVARKVDEAHAAGVFSTYSSSQRRCDDPACAWASWLPTHGHYHDEPQPHWTHCREVREGKRGTPCHERHEYVVSYSYGAARGGGFASYRGMTRGASRHTREVCRRHAETFAKRYGVPMPE